MDWSEKPWPSPKKNCLEVGKKRSSVDSVLCIKLKMPLTFWKCRQPGEIEQLAMMLELFLSRQGLKQRPHGISGVANTSDLQRNKCGGLQCVLRHWLSGRTGFGGTWRKSPIWCKRKGNWRDCYGTTACCGCSAQGKERTDIEQEAEKYVYFCSKFKAYCLGDKMWTALLWNDCAKECVCISTLLCFSLSHTAQGLPEEGPGNIVQMQIWVDL